MTTSSSPAIEVRAWLESASTATLCTLLDHEEAPGSPFGSIVPYALDDAGRPIVVISDIAVHTKNLKKDARASLLVVEPGSSDVQAGWRVTLVGAMRELTGELAHTALQRYGARHPTYSGVHGFSPWALDVTATRFIAGFGKMGWL